MSKKSKKTSSEDLVKSILEDLQNDIDDVSLGESYSESDDADSDQEEREKTYVDDGLLGSGGVLVHAEDRKLPGGLTGETAVFGFSKKKSSRSSSKNKQVKAPPEVSVIDERDERNPFDHLDKAPSGDLVPKQDIAPVVATPIAALTSVPSPTPSPAASPTPSPSALEYPPVAMNDEATHALSEHSATRRIAEDLPSVTFRSDYTDRTQPMVRPVSNNDVATKISHGFSRPLTKSSASLAASASEVQMMQAENLRFAQARIMDLEKEVEQLRQENELLASAGEIAKRRAEELFEKVQEIDRMKVDALDQAQMEMNIYRENLVDKDRQLSRMRQKIDELQTRLAKDLKKIRVRERELENRLELSKMEKTALVRAKDDAIIDLRNKVDQLHAELEVYKGRCSELGQKVDGQHEQLGRTVRALRLALTHLESNDTAGNVTPLKKAE